MIQVIHPYISYGSGSADPQFRIIDPDPGGQLTTDPPDPVPEHWFETGIITLKAKKEAAS
jgi:hypothetical protein